MLVILTGLPLIGAVMITMSTQAAAECRTQADTTVSSELGDLGDIEGPVGGPVKGSVTLSQANIKVSLPLSAFNADLNTTLRSDPDFVTLNEISSRSLGQIQSAAPGYEVFREDPAGGPDSIESIGSAVLWKRDAWTKVNAGRVKIVSDDQLYSKGNPRTWDRYATWVMLQRKSDGAVVSVIATHHMTNPHKFPRQHGNPALTRAQQYGAGMDILVQLTNSLASHGPVVIGGDMNTHASYTDLPWSAVSKMTAAGYGWANHSVDFVFFPQSQGARLANSSTGPLVSDHQWLTARIDMNGAGPSSTSGSTPGTATVADTSSTGSGSSGDVDDAAGDAGEDVDAAGAAPPAGDVLPALMQLRFSEAYPTLTAEQARNAVTIAQVARDLRVPRYGLEVAIATAIQESKLVNLDGGDRDSGGLLQQRPSTGWGSRAQVTNPTLAAQAFFGRAQHTSNPGLLDIPGWEQMPLTEAAQAVQRSGLPGAYAQWEDVTGDITDILGGDLPEVPGGDVEIASTTTSTGSCTDGDTIAPITVGTLNLLGAGHTSGPDARKGFSSWQARLPGAMSSLKDAGITIAALQEVHGPQADAMASRYSQQWGMYPSSGPTQNKVIWDLNEWSATDQRLVDIPYFGGHDVGMPLVQLTSTTTGQAIWVWSIHNPANTQGNVFGRRVEALRRQLDTLDDLAATGTPTVIGGGFNDGGDGTNASHCVLTPTVTNAFGGSSAPCRQPKKDAPIDHIYGANLTWASARVDNGTQSQKISDHPLVVATTAGSSAGCALTSGATNTNYNLGQVKAQLTQLVNVLGPMFDIKTVGGYRDSATDPNGHPAGLAADFMVPLSSAGRAQGQALADYAKQHAGELGIDYIIWYQQIWSTSRASEGWRPMDDRGSATENHRDHVHINVKPGDPFDDPVSSIFSGGETASCSEIVYPVPAAYVGNDAHNWHSQGSAWDSWHTGTDFGALCGTSVYAAHSGTVEIDTTQSWAGPTLVKVSTGPISLTTWYAHMQQVTVSRGETVQAGQQIGMVGDEGNSRGCHLHFEVHLENGSIYGADNVDPSQWLAENASPNGGTVAARAA
ncbi:peptidoglycan DD-metalloendopeptidase family protein [Nocardioides aquaticus]|uniref:peptidoglycan DD-metalloendopeptidase family protein n=1 Tax=Nocardioides aquaticus TaxID=160826 RepID=UPI001BD4167F|nr:peptidoglycan DD-metalloendopeptidase family protein [Nocardioides aquaticus]